MACRQEVSKRYPVANGRVVTVYIRNGIVPEDPLISGARCKALSVRTGEVNDTKRVSRTIKDYLIKTNVSI